VISQGAFGRADRHRLESVVGTSILGKRSILVAAMSAPMQTIEW
jgi:hypothetical protein